MQLQYITFKTNCKIFHFSIKAQINKTWNTTHFYFPGHSKVWWWSISNFHLQINLFILIKITKWDSFHTRNFPFFGPLFKHTFSAVSKAVFPRRKESLEVNTCIHLFSNSYSDLFLHFVSFNWFCFSRETLTPWTWDTLKCHNCNKCKSLFRKRHMELIQHGSP